MLSVSEKRLNFLRLRLLKSRGWRYLRYLHLRDFIASNIEYVKTVGICGAGLGFAELAIAVEFSDIEFTLTDVVIAGRPNYFRVMDLCLRWGIRNVRFGVWDLLGDPPAKFDAVASTEVLEHIQPARSALESKIKASKFATYTLVPYATSQENNDAEKRMAAYLTAGHFVCGFSEEFFHNFNHEPRVSGVFWRKNSIRSILERMSDSDIDNSYDKLINDAELDLTIRPPERLECSAIKAIIFQ